MFFIRNQNIIKNMEKTSNNEEDYKEYCKVCNFGDCCLNYQITDCCENNICESCLQKMTNYICPICSVRFAYNFICTSHLPLFNTDTLFGKYRRKDVKITIIITDDLETSQHMEKNDLFYHHWSKYTLTVKKSLFIDTCQLLAGYWEKHYPIDYIKYIEYLLEKNKHTDFNISTHDIIPDIPYRTNDKNESNLIPNKIFIYSEIFALMFERTDESESIIIDKIIEP